MQTYERLDHFNVEPEPEPEPEPELEPEPEPGTTDVRPEPEALDAAREEDQQQRQENTQQQQEQADGEEDTDGDAEAAKRAEIAAEEAGRPLVIAPRCYCLFSRTPLFGPMFAALYGILRQERARRTTTQLLHVPPLENPACRSEIISH
eukprot:COSAG01_NODE_380_length_17862_cov_20.427212_4_plen_149_part_00